jgi:hypothetical protein
MADLAARAKQAPRPATPAVTAPDGILAPLAVGVVVIAAGAFAIVRALGAA